MRRSLWTQPAWRQLQTPWQEFFQARMSAKSFVVEGRSARRVSGGTAPRASCFRCMPISRRRPCPACPHMMQIEHPRSILVIKLRYIGDVVLSTPVLSRLREGFPKARITMLVNAGTEEVVQEHPALDEVLIVGRGSMPRQWRMLSELRRRRFDLVVDLTDADRSAILSWLSGASTRVGYNSENRWRGRLYTDIVQADRFGMHTAHYHLAAVKALGLSGRASDPHITVG